MSRKSIFRDVHGKEFLRPKGALVQWRPSGYALVLNNQNQVLVIIPPWGEAYCLPGGRIELNEEIISGIERESVEETGRRIRVSSPAPFYVRSEYFYWRKKSKKPKYYRSLIMIYRGVLADKKRVPSMPDRREVGHVTWISLEKITEHNCQWAFWPAIQQLQRELKLQC